MVRPEHQDTNINSKYHKVMAWLSPSFPVGAFAYSHGLEFEISVGNISRSDDLYNWLSDILQYGSVWNDLILFCEAYKAKENALNHLSETAKAFAQSKERYTETTEMGKAFSKIISSGLTNTATNLIFFLSIFNNLCNFSKLTNLGLLG